MNAYLKIVCFSMAVVLISGQDINQCFEQDSISCVQKSLYRKAKEFFTKDNIELFSGVSLVKAADRNSRTAKDVIYDQEIDAANDVEGRQSALENFVSDEASDFLTGRSLRINFAPVAEKIGQTARAMVDSVPQEVRQAVDEVVEGRGKKKLLKTLLPFLAIAKLKMGALAVLSYFGIALLAKKAIFASLISLAFSAFIGLRSLWSKGADTTAYNAGWNSGNVGAWAPPATNGWSSGGWDDSHGNNYAGTNQPFSGYH
ncbi:Protein of unknown function [Cotesia congregata]|uniref:Uncharacterized protein n=1 Tax=Cotesia congregata TaxID=51543 RepID=A0A8J2H684_COTCN|nr:Protein of unknown function [Cotesia congregata]